MGAVVLAPGVWAVRAFAIGIALSTSVGCGGGNTYGRLPATAETGTGGHRVVRPAETGGAGGSGDGADAGSGGVLAADATGGAGAGGGAGAPRSGSGGGAVGGTSGSGGAGLGSGGAGLATGGRAGTGGAAGGGGAAGAAGTAGTGGAAVALAFRPFRHGISLGNRLDPPTEGAWGPVLNATDFPLVARRGFDHVRLPIRFSSHALASAPYTVDAAFFTRIDQAVSQARAAGVAIVLALAQYVELYATPDAQGPRFIALWSQIADHYRNAGPEVAFELLSEPSAAMSATWNALATSALQAIRPSNPTRVVIIDSANVAAAATLPDLNVPADANVMASFHGYEPALFSFQGMAWMGPIYATTGIVFPGPPATPVMPVQAALDTPWAKQWFDDYNALPAAQNPAGPKSILTEIQQAKDFVARTGHPVYNGQWGPQMGGDTTSRANFMRMVRVECEKANIGWAVWDDATNLKLFDSAAGTWVEPLVAPLFP